MPVGILFCEGGPKSPDIRTLSAILAGTGCVIRPSGGKYGLGYHVRARREIQTGVVAAGILDRDFDADTSQPHNRPRDWRVEGGEIWLGWRWERKEIENYLFDPGVVARALGSKKPPADEYQRALQNAAQTIAAYTAARTALSISRLRFQPLPNAWGRERGQERRKFPDNLDEQDCRNGIQRLVAEHAQIQTVQPDDVLLSFDDVLPHCHPGGARFQHYLTFFSGNDLAFAMRDALAEWGFASPFVFKESILKGLEKSKENIWSWLPEWENLRNLIVNTDTMV